MVGQVKEIKSLKDFNEIINSGKPVLIDFWATWCGPCKVISPIFEKLAAAAPEGLEFYKVDVDDQEEISAAVGIRAMPTFHMFKDGKIEKTVMGANPAGLQALVNDAAALVA